MTADPALAAALLTLLGDWLWAGWLVFLRVGAAMALLPAFGEQAVPMRLRLALALGFTAIVTPAALPGLPPPPEGPALLLRFHITEVICGLALGLAARIFVWLLEIAGAMIAQSVSLSQLFGGMAADPQPAIARLLVLAGLALAVMSGLHVRIAEALIRSYETLPAGVFPGATDLALWGVDRVGAIFALAFAFSAPFVIAALVYNVALGVINRAMPQLMVAFVGAPAITAGGLMLLALAVPLMLPLWLEALQAQLADPLGSPR